MVRNFSDGAYMASDRTLYAFIDEYDITSYKKVRFLEEFFDTLWHKFGFRPFDANEARGQVEFFNTQDVIKMLNNGIERGILEKKNIR